MGVIDVPTLCDCGHGSGSFCCCFTFPPLPSTVSHKGLSPDKEEDRKEIELLLAQVYMRLGDCSVLESFVVPSVL